MGNSKSRKTGGATKTKATHPVHVNTTFPLFEKLPQFMRLQIFHFLPYRDYLRSTFTCKRIQSDLTFSLKYKLRPVCFHVPQDFATLQAVLKETERISGCLVTIILGKGDHSVDGNSLTINSPMNIIGARNVRRNKINLLGGVHISVQDNSNVHLEHLTICHLNGIGVRGFSSFTLKDINITNCRFSGMVASGFTTVARCTNLRVFKCGFSGIRAYDGATITLVGPETSVQKNCTNWSSHEIHPRGNNNLVRYTKYSGLKIDGSFSTIQLVSPLTKERVSINNHQDHNWGCDYTGNINQIKTIIERGNHPLM
jgi:hypothetical protein